jgi:hypothetical protein
VAEPYGLLASEVGPGKLAIVNQITTHDHTPVSMPRPTAIPPPTQTTQKLNRRMAISAGYGPGN